MNKQLIRDLAITDGIYDCICDPYDQLNNGDPYSSVMIDLERFAERIVAECVSIAQSADDDSWKLDGKGTEIARNIQQHFEVEQRPN